MPEIIDDEFGHITVRRLARSRSIRFSVATSGRLAASAPRLTPLFIIRQVLESSRPALRKLFDDPRIRIPYEDGQQIGSHHHLGVVQTHMVTKPEVQTTRSTLVVKLPPATDLESPHVQQLVRDEVTKILRREAKLYLPDRLAEIAKEWGFSYERVRFSHSSGRWGSCSSTGTISLNIALMKLPSELVDYVLVHELCHTRHMDHSKAFWAEVERINPHYRLHRRQIARHSPTV
ncbi:MAG: SprT family zinc-dependent metalloprotease [Candidatus Saccharimonas sp.]